ncbi:MAG: hypothetical protein CMG75_10635 [Candidatus Marinimicrobia bacterium]|nr:hypothetical protein [Candidatus Neomarinimicrobiota bacterium]|tara:strand:- start:11474 stop:12511 length:1038 start_codon:yes stop_codon:yes gene_type:complete
MKNTEIKENNRWAIIEDMIGKAENLILSTHINPDGDGIGSQLAMASYLKKLGKKFIILNPSPVSYEIQFLSEYADFLHYDRSTHKYLLPLADLVIVLDIGDYSRLGYLGEDLLEVGLQMVSIDHHPHQEPNKFSYAIHDTSACSTGFLIFDYLKYVYGTTDSLSKEAADGLYVALMTDTGSFRFSNADADSHEMASELIRLGVKPHELYQKVYESLPLEKVKLLALALGTIHMAGHGKLAWFVITEDMIKDAGASKEHVSGFTDTVRSIQGVEVAIMIHELSENKTRLNFRSKGKVKINGLARKFGGGGHQFAAGALVDKPLDIVREAIVAEGVSEIEHQLKKGV